MAIERWQILLRSEVGRVCYDAALNKRFSRLPNIAATIWRTVSDTGAKRYFFESSYSPSIFWVGVAKLKLEEGSAPARLDLSGHPILSGEVSDKFVAAEPFKFLSRYGRCMVAVVRFEGEDRRWR